MIGSNGTLFLLWFFLGLFDNDLARFPFLASAPSWCALMAAARIGSLGDCLGLAAGQHRPYITLA